MKNSNKTFEIKETATLTAKGKKKAAEAIKTNDVVAPVDAMKKVEVKKAAPKKKVSMTKFVDELIFDGGTFDELSAKAQKEGNRRGLKQKYTKKYFEGHIAFRTNQNKNWLKDNKLKVSDKGIAVK